MANLVNLADKMEKLAKQIDNAASNCAIDTARFIINNLAYQTPVDTTQAVSNWQLGLGSAKTNFIPPHFLGMFGQTHHASAQKTLALAEEEFKKKKPGQAIHITNNAPYIQALNNGSSKQAPAGFVEKAVLLASYKVSKMNLRFSK